MFLSQLFQGDAILEAVANNEARISRQENNLFDPVHRIQTALLIRDPNALPQFGADGDYGNETAGAVSRFKIEELGVPPGEVIDDVGPRTVSRLDEIAFNAQDHPEQQVAFTPKVIVKLADDLARQLPYTDNLQDFFPPDLRALWDSIVPGLTLTLNRGLPTVDPEAVQAWLTTNEETNGSPSTNLLGFFVIPVAAEMAETVAAAVQALPFVEQAYVEQSVKLATVVADDPLIVGQGYLGVAPFGVDAPHVWNLPFADGSQVRFVDVEFGWQLTHEDLVDTNGVNRIPILPSGTFSAVSGDIDHGTAVLGIVMATDNTKGILGLAPNVQAAVAPIPLPAGTQAVSAALAVVGSAPDIGAGSVVLIPAQDGQNRPVETDLFTRHAILELTRKGITVVEAAGNGPGNGVNLDTFSDIFFGTIFDRNSGAFFDSGATMVAAGTSVHPHARAHFPVESSNFGNRIDCFAWGENILTTSSLLDPVSNQPYTATFGGTSGASAIVGGVVVVLQNIRRSVIGDFLLPSQIRDLLRDRNLNTRPVTADDDLIRVMPNLATLEPAARAL
jgi:peptidoglycan hydrolase-like protein with peptidoglycan-binding domain